MGQQTLFIAAGHGGADRGNTAAGVIERDELLQVAGGMRRWAGLLGERLNALGGVVFLPDQLDLIGEITAIGQQWKASSADGDLAIDVHLDFRPGSSGALILYDEAPQSKQFAERFLPRWCQATGIRNNGVFRSNAVAQAWRGWDDFGFCRPTGWAGVIIELGCLNAALDLEVVRDPYYQAVAMQLIRECWRG